MNDQKFCNQLHKPSLDYEFSQENRAIILQCKQKKMLNRNDKNGPQLCSRINLIFVRGSVPNE